MVTGSSVLGITYDGGIILAADKLGEMRIAVILHRQSVLNITGARFFV